MKKTINFQQVISYLFLICLLGFLASCKKDTIDTKTLTVNITPTEAGSISKDPDQSDYEINTSVTLTAIPNLGYYFSQWSSDGSGSINPFIIIMNSDKIINAIFEKGVIEDFNDGVADYFIADGRRWSIKDNAYKMTGTYLNTTAYSCYPYIFSDFELSVDLKVTQSSTASHAFGIYFKSQSYDLEENSYRISIMSDGRWYLGKYNNSVFTFITDNWIESNDLNKGLNATNNIKIICIGTQTKVYFNNIYQGLSTLSTFTSGYTGILGYDSDKYHNEFIFDNFKVVTTGIGFKSATLKNTTDIDITKIKGIKRDPDGNNY